MDDKHRILIVDDEAEVRDWLAALLEDGGFASCCAGDGAAMRRALAEHPFALVILDLKLKGEDGLTLARELRRQSAVPIIMMSGKGDETDRVLGLELAADDYLTKPFSGRELLARVRAALRRTTELSIPLQRHPGEAHECYAFNGWVLDMTARELHQPDGTPCPLTQGEFTLLATLVKHPQRVWSREQLLEQTRGLDTEVYDRTIDVLILRLRRKIEPNPRHPELICTERGLGYQFRATVSRH
ncbi:response regulator [Pseudogulbenkiania sp. MAI-1]|uniref:response regulator n=1 Tax=Pseudogulbenkiania sp. MAI-1 TaxID=990370 RepID=UPI00045E87FF|nr:response regulator transcription factor [Pseudogulbenkiania sp. MAI-1]